MAHCQQRSVDVPARLPIKNLTASLVLAIALFGSVEGRVLVVPDSAATIQQGFDELTESDTLFVRQGWYPEAVVAPSIQFVMIGESSGDSVIDSRSIIDATFLAVHDTVPVLRLPDQSRADISGIHFRNTNRAGVVCTGQEVVIENCIFDSLKAGFVYARDNAGVTVVVRNSQFMGNYEKCLQVRSGNVLVASHCSFTSSSSEHVRPQLSAGSSRIDSCSFASQIPTPLIYGFDGPHHITNCTFGPVTTDLNQFAVQIVGSTVRLEDNQFVDCEYAFRAIDIQSTSPDFVEIRNNRFVNCHSPDSVITAQGVISVAAQGESALGPVISRNLFDGCYSSAASDDIFLVPYILYRLDSNEFLRDRLNGLPSVYAGNPDWQPTPVTMTGNQFMDCGYAVDLGITADARFNYWGDMTGPYHATRNPFGLGDTITGDVPFVPWLEDTISGVDGSRPEVADDMQLFLYPNPFNATVMIEYALTREQDVTLEIFDVLGRQVETLLSERQGIGVHLVKWNADAFASGLYFARLSTVDPMRSSQTVKLLLVK